MKFLKILLVFIAGSILSTTSVAAWGTWATLKTRHFTVFYHPGHEDEAKLTLQTLEYYRPRVEQLCGNQEFHLSFVINSSTFESKSSISPNILPSLPLPLCAQSDRNRKLVGNDGYS